MPVENATLGLVFAGVLLLVRLMAGTLTPLFLDSLTPSRTILYNISSPGVSPVPVLPSIPSWHRIDPFFCIWISMGFDTLMLGTIVLLMKCLSPHRITRRETSFPKSTLLFSGSAQAVSALLFQFSSSGSRTAPYLFGVLGYFFVPISFTLRFLILRKRPTRRKLLCAMVVVLAEFLSLIPSIFPQLESETARQQEGGATGIGRILWPMCLVTSQIPHAIWSIVLERTVKTTSSDKTAENSGSNSSSCLHPTTSTSHNVHHASTSHNVHPTDGTSHNARHPAIHKSSPLTDDSNGQDGRSDNSRPIEVHNVDVMDISHDEPMFTHQPDERSGNLTDQANNVVSGPQDNEHYEAILNNEYDDHEAMLNHQQSADDEKAGDNDPDVPGLKDGDPEASGINTLNMAYVMFWNFFGTFLTTILLFWVDLIPGFGLMPDIAVFGKQLIFNVKCIVGATPECGFHQIFTAWGRMVFKTSSFVTAGLLLRYGDGANFYAIMAAIQQPLRFLTFTLFDEQPFRWHPHATISTWLSVVSLCIMFPTVIIYSRSPTDPDSDNIPSAGAKDDDMSESSALISNVQVPQSCHVNDCVCTTSNSINQATQRCTNLNHNNHQHTREPRSLMTQQSGSCYGSIEDC